MGEARLAKMHLAVDHARQHVQAFAIDALARGSGAQSPDPGGSPVANAEVAQPHAVLVDHGSVEEPDRRFAA